MSGYKPFERPSLPEKLPPRTTVLLYRGYEITMWPDEIFDGVLGTA